ncbi:MAG TPA: SRPBCC family protein [Burkholderiales bacterium]|nr:SRPBCC family protein [Burkholderiales bacterium]
MAPFLLIGVALGGAAMYYLDPERGRRRRALVRDKVVRAQHDAHELWEQGTRDLANRAGAMKGRAQSMLTRRKASDQVLAERVRSKMGRYIGHPGAVEVAAAGGVVTLTGSILAHEHAGVLEGVSKVSGVRDIVDQLNVYERAEGISELQGEPRARRGEQAEPLQENWAPGTRLVAGAGGTALTLYALMRSNRLAGFITFATGVAILARTITNKPLGRTFGLAGADAIHVQKTININAPVDVVFEYLANYDNFPQFMRNVLSVDMLADGRSHWKVMGPAGVPVEWDAITTALELNDAIEWSTVEGSPVEHVGRIRLEPAGEGTRVHIQMSYTPPAGVLGHAVAKLTGSDPKTQLDQDMMRLKSTLETGRAPRDAAAQRQEQAHM